MRNHHEDIEKICDRVRLLVLTTREFLSNPSKEEAEQIVEECDRLALAILPLFKTERLATLPLLPHIQNRANCRTGVVRCRISWDTGKFDLVPMVCRNRFWNSIGFRNNCDT